MSTSSKDSQVGITNICQCVDCTCKQSLPGVATVEFWLATQDFLTASYLLTSKDRFYTRAQMGQLICQMGDALSRVELPQPALLKPMELWTGKQVFSMLVRPSSQARYDFLFHKARLPVTSSAAGSSHQPMVIATVQG